MLSERSRNVIVGLTFLAAVGVCMYGIMLLGKFPLFGAIRQYNVRVVAANANGVTLGSKVEFNGVYAGQVESVWLDSDDKGNVVANMKINVEPDLNIPVSASATLVRPSTVGTPYIALTATDFKPPYLAKNGTAVLTATVADSGLIPQNILNDVHELKESLSGLSLNLNTVAKDLHVLLAYTPPEALVGVDPNDPNAPKENASTVIVRLNRTVASLQTLLTDPKLQGQVREAVQNIADASARFKTTLGKLDKTLDGANIAITAIGMAAQSFDGTATQATAAIQSTQKDIDRVTQQIVETLVQLDKSIKRITEGQGTTGRLVNDPRLYDGLVDLSKSLKTTVDDLDFLLNKWKDEGINMKLK